MTDVKKPYFVPQELQQEQPSAIALPSPVVKEEKPSTLSTLKSTSMIHVAQPPSGKKAYPQAEIHYRTYSFGELKNFAQSKLSLRQRYEFILSGIETTGVEKRKLTLNDFLFVALLRKLSSIGGQELTITFKCQECGFSNKKHVKLDSLAFEELDVPELPVWVNIDGVDMSFTPLTVDDFYFLLDHGKDKDAVSILAVQCRSHSFADAEKIIFGASAENTEIFDEIQKRFYHSLEVLKIPCLNLERETTEIDEEGEEVKMKLPCKHINTIELGDPGLIVQPFRRDIGTSANKLRFGSRNGVQS